MGHIEQCEKRVIAYAQELAELVRRRKFNATRFEGLIDSFLEQPAYSPSLRHAYKEVAMKFAPR